MGEHMADRLEKLVVVLRWHQKYDEAQAVSSLAQLCGKYDLREWTDVRKFIDLVGATQDTGA